MDIPSAKKQTIVDFYAWMASEKYENKSLIIFTSAGIISGKPVVDFEKSDAKAELNSKESYAMTCKLLATIGDAYKKSYSIKSPLPGNDGFIMLKDVTVKSAGIESSFTSMVVFFDQIIGISLEDLDS